MKTLTSYITLSIALISLNAGAANTVAHRFNNFVSHNNCQANIAPQSIAGLTFNLTVDQPSSVIQAGFATQGAIAQSYTEQQQFSGIAAGDPTHQANQGHYSYHRLGANKAVEQAVDFVKGAYVTYYTFATPSSGQYQQTFSGGDTVINGTFSAINSNATALAPTSIAGLNIALTITDTVSDLPGGYPTSGVVVQTYSSDNTYTAKGIGEGNIDSIGSYQYQRLSANTAVETALQMSDFFTLPYTMVYTFETENSGTWYQNFAGGTIIFKGTFSTFK